MKIPSLSSLAYTELTRRSTQAIGDVLKGQKKFWSKKLEKVKA